jgi:hypothetical protein
MIRASSMGRRRAGLLDAVNDPTAGSSSTPSTLDRLDLARLAGLLGSDGGRPDEDHAALAGERAARHQLAAEGAHLDRGRRPPSRRRHR